MPELVTQYYKLGGWQQVLLYSEAEMAAALGLTPAELRQAITAGRFIYSQHPNSNPSRQYYFSGGDFVKNLAWLVCELTAGIDDPVDDCPGLAQPRCPWCGRERYE